MRWVFFFVRGTNSEMQELLEFASSTHCEPEVKFALHAAVASFTFADTVMPHLVLPEPDAQAARSVGSLAGYRCPENSKYIPMPLDGVPQATVDVLKRGELFVCPVTGVYHECGPDRCNAAQRIDATQVCPLTSRTWPYHDPTVIDYEQRDGVVMRPNYINRVDRRVQKRLDALASDDAFRQTMQRDAMFEDDSTQKDGAPCDDDKQRHIMELLSTVGVVPAPAPVKQGPAKSHAALLAASKQAAAKAKEAAKEGEAERKRLRDRLTDEEKRKLAAEREEARQKRNDERLKESKARKPTAKRGDIDKELRLVSASQKLKHSGKFELQTRRIPKSATTTRLKDPSYGIAEIDTIVRKVFVEQFKNPADRAVLSSDERKYLYDRCRTLWHEILQSPAFALRPNRFDPVNTILFVIFHGMRGQGIQTPRFRCLPQAWSCRSTADIAQASDILKIPNKLSQRSVMIIRMLNHSDELDEAPENKKQQQQQQQQKPLTEREKRAAAIRSWRVSTGETYGELIQRFADRFDTPNAMPVSYCPYSSSARYPPAPPPPWRRL